MKGRLWCQDWQQLAHSNSENIKDIIITTNEKLLNDNLQTLYSNPYLHSLPLRVQPILSFSVHTERSLYPHSTKLSSQLSLK